MTRAVFLTLSGLSATALGGAIASAQRGGGGVFYPNCAAVRARARPRSGGANPEPGYSPKLDRDGDGIACEPCRGGGSFNRGRRRRSD